MAPRNQNSIPAGWRWEHQTDKKGNIREYYTNELGQKFYSMEDLMRYVNYAMKAQLSIYAPPSRSDHSSSAKTCSKEKRKRTSEKSSFSKTRSKGKRKRTTETSSSKEEKQKKNRRTAKNGGTKRNSIIKFHHIFHRLSQQLNKPTKRQKHGNYSAQRQNIKDASDKTLPRRASRKLARNAPKYGGLDIAATTHHVPNSPARQSLALTVLPHRASRRLSRQAPEYVPDFDPLLKY